MRPAFDGFGEAEEEPVRLRAEREPEVRDLLFGPKPRAVYL